MNFEEFKRRRRNGKTKEERKERKKKKTSNRRKLKFEKYNQQPLFANLEELSSIDQHVYLDTSILLDPNPTSKLFTAFDILTDPSEHYCDDLDQSSIRRIIAMMNEKSRFYQSYLKKPNVYIIPGVRQECHGWAKRYSERAKTLKLPSPLSNHNIEEPLRVILSAIEENRRRIRKSGIERDSISDSVYEILLGTLKARQRILPTTDRRLITYAVASGLLTGKDSAVVSNDGGIEEEFHKIDKRPKTSMLKNPERFNPTTVSMYRFEIKNGTPGLKIKSGIYICPNEL